MIHSIIFIYRKGGYINLVDTFDIYKMIEFVFISRNQTRYPEIYNTHTHCAPTTKRLSWFIQEKITCSTWNPILFIHDWSKKTLISVKRNRLTHMIRSENFMEQHTLPIWIISSNESSWFCLENYHHQTLIMIHFCSASPTSHEYLHIHKILHHFLASLVQFYEFQNVWQWKSKTFEKDAWCSATTPPAERISSSPYSSIQSR